MKQKRSELTQEMIICPYCDEVYDGGADWLPEVITTCENCNSEYKVEVYSRSNLYITKKYIKR